MVTICTGHGRPVRPLGKAGRNKLNRTVHFLPFSLPECIPVDLYSEYFPPFGSQSECCFMSAEQLKQRDAMQRLTDFLNEVGMLRHTPRSGYKFLGSGQETVAEHSHRTAVIGYVLAKKTGADAARTVRRAGRVAVSNLPSPAARPWRTRPCRARGPAGRGGRFSPNRRRGGGNPAGRGIDRPRGQS